MRRTFRSHVRHPYLHRPQALRAVVPDACGRAVASPYQPSGEHPGMKLSELTQKLFYGRTAA
jgi:hypothetical protein